jgi:hypothetical protein
MTQLERLRLRHLEALNDLLLNFLSACTRVERHSRTTYDLANQYFLRYEQLERIYRTDIRRLGGNPLLTPEPQAEDAQA